MPLRREDLRIIGHVLSPDYVVPAAEAYGKGDPVMGAAPAYREVHEVLRSYARYVAHRDREKVTGRGLAQALARMGYVNRTQPVLPERLSEWRETAAVAWEQSSGAIPGWVEAEVGAVPYDRLTRAVVRSLSRVLSRNRRLNRAVLRGRVYQRQTTEIMLAVSPAPDDVRTVVLDPFADDDRRLKRAIFRALRVLREPDHHPLRVLAGPLLRAWLRAGFIASPAAAMVSPVGGVGVRGGFDALLRGNGVPLALAIGKVRDGRVTITVTADHRAFDADTLGPLYEALEQEVPRLCA